jgi:hypothetical protein
VYYNAALDDEPSLEEETMTARVKRPLPPNGLAAMTKGRTFLNHNDAGLNYALKELLDGLFPNPSRWEA